jgi:hypothetical protein
MGEWSITPRILNLGIRWMWVVSFALRSLYPCGKNPQYPLDRRLFLGAYGTLSASENELVKEISQHTPGTRVVWEDYSKPHLRGAAVLHLIDLKGAAPLFYRGGGGHLHCGDLIARHAHAYSSVPRAQPATRRLNAVLSEAYPISTYRISLLYSTYDFRFLYSTCKKRINWTRNVEVRQSVCSPLRLQNKITLYVLTNYTPPPNANVTKIKSLIKSSFKNVSMFNVTGYELDDWRSRVRFPAGAGSFSLHHQVQKGSGAHPASYPKGTRGSFPGGKATVSWSWPLTSI